MSAWGLPGGRLCLRSRTIARPRASCNVPDALSPPGACGGLLRSGWAGRGDARRASRWLKRRATATFFGQTGTNLRFGMARRRPGRHGSSSWQTATWGNASSFEVWRRRRAPCGWSRRLSAIPNRKLVPSGRRKVAVRVGCAWRRGLGAGRSHRMARVRRAIPRPRVIATASSKIVL